MAEWMVARRIPEERRRRSRDICQEERTKEKRAHRILRYEFYVECSCGFKGRSQNHACQKCGAEIDFGFSGFGVLS
jgi:hypothetical protein